MALIKSTAIPSGATDFELEQSLKFNEARSPYLNRTPSSASNRKTFTYSCWMKIGNISNDNNLLHARESANDRFHFLMTSNYLGVSYYVGGTEKWIRTTPLLRDPSAWYHIVLRVDTTQSTSTDRVRIYVNGEVQHLYTGQMPTQNWDLAVNNNVEHRIGQRISNNDYKIDGYLAEIHLVDGASLAPTSFGETGTYGEWKPLEVDVTHGTNGFYLPFKQDYTVEGFSTVTYKGTGVDETYIGGVGFQSDLTWIARRGNAENHIWIDSVRGTNKRLLSNLADAEATDDNIITGFTTDGFTIGTDAGTNAVDTYVAWNWDMGGSNATNTDGSITSTVRANTTYGQSIVTYDGNNGGTVGHGLDSAPNMLIWKQRDGTDAWMVWHSGYGNNGFQQLNTTAAAVGEYSWFMGSTAPSSTLVTMGNGGTVNASGNSYVMYAFHDVTGYSKFGTYSGTGSTGLSVTTGFRPAFVMIKVTSTADSWFISDSTRDPSNPANKMLFANLSSAESTSREIDFDDNGFTIQNTSTSHNNSGQTYIYMAFADKREYAYWLDQSGNNNDWTSNNLTESDISVDSPTNNFATWNPLSSIVLPTLSEGNLKSGGENNKAMAGTFGVSTGKWYWEINVLNNSQIVPSLGVTKFSMENDPDVSPTLAATSGRSTYRFRATPLYKNFTATAYANDSAHGLADYGILGLALDLDNGTLKYYVNNTLYHTDSTIPSDGTILYPLLTETYAGGSGWNTTVANFGQDSSFAGTKTAQGNQDGNNIGDFYYTPPTGFLALCTKNLPDVAVVPSEHFNTITYTGTDADDRAITGVGFQPDFAWFKRRNTATNHGLFDVLRGANKRLSTNLTDAEFSDSNALMSFDSDGYTVSSDGTTNAAGTYVAWNWKANGSGSSGSSGTGGLSVVNSANVDAGFSIISWTGNMGVDTFSHGLSKAPEFLIVKNRDNAGTNWIAWHKDFATNYNISLNLTNPSSENGQYFFGDDTNMTVPDSTYITIGNNNQVNATSKKIICYAWHSVDGYSKVGSYVGNGNADGTFVYTGFRPAYVMIKNATSSGTHWLIWDKNRSGYNDDNTPLYGDLNNGEGTGGSVDLTSNGFKLRATSSLRNENGSTIIYIAFAETPFKYSNAR